MRPYFSILVSALVLASVSCAWASPAEQANTTKGTKENALSGNTTANEEGYIPINHQVVVTATRTEKTLAEVPASITFVDEEQINQSQGTTIKDVLDMVPNLSFTDSSLPFTQKPSLRGAGSQNTTILIDGARQNYTSNTGIGLSPVFVDPDMLKEIEVLRGASSVMHGSGGTGGVISMTTKDAADMLDYGDNIGARIKFGAQSATTEFMQSAAVYGRHGMFDLVAQGTFRQLGDGNTTHTTPDKSTFERNGNIGSAMLKLAIEPTDDQRITINYNYYEGEQSYPGDPTKYTLSENRLLGSYEFSPKNSPWVDFKAVVQTSWRDNAFDNGTRDIEDDFDSYGLSVQNTSRLDLGENFLHAFTYGIDYYEDSQSSFDHTMGTVDSGRPNAESKDLGFFIQDEMTIMNFLTITPALRYTSYKRSSEDGLGSEQSESELTPQISALAQVTPWFNIFGSYAESYRPPSPDEMYFSMPWPGILVIPNPDLKPESAKTWEAGFSLDFDNVFADSDPLLLKAVYFSTDAKDFISSEMVGFDGSGNMLFQTINRGEVHRYGFEVEARYAYENLGLALSYGKVIGRDKETDNAVGGSPETFNFRADYYFVDWDLNVFWRSKFVSKYETVDAWDNDLSYSAYDIHGLGFTWEPSTKALEGFRLDASIDNLFDARYFNEYGGTEIGQNFKVAVTYKF